MQIMLKDDDLGKGYDLVNLLDPGGFLGVFGTVMISKTGETTVQALKFTILENRCVRCRQLARH